MKKLHLLTVEQFTKIMFLDLKIEKRIFHFLLYRISLKDSENLETSLCIRDKTEKPYKPMTLRSSGSTALNTDISLSWKSMHELRKVLEIIVHEHSSLCHPQMHVKALSCKEEAICEHDPETMLHILKDTINTEGQQMKFKSHRILYQTKMGQHSSPKNPTGNRSPLFPDLYIHNIFCEIGKMSWRWYRMYRIIHDHHI